MLILLGCVKFSNVCAFLCCWFFTVFGFLDVSLVCAWGEDVPTVFKMSRSFLSFFTVSSHKRFFQLPQLVHLVARWVGWTVLYSGPVFFMLWHQTVMYNIVCIISWVVFLLCGHGLWLGLFLIFALLSCILFVECIIEWKGKLSFIQTSHPVMPSINKIHNDVHSA